MLKGDGSTECLGLSTASPSWETRATFSFSDWLETRAGREVLSWQPYLFLSQEGRENWGRRLVVAPPPGCVRWRLSLRVPGQWAGLGMIAPNP